MHGVVTDNARLRSRGIGARLEKGDGGYRMKDPIKRRVSMLLGGALAWAMVAGFGPASAQPAVPSYLKAEGRSFMLDNARLIDGSGAPARENVTLVIENGLVSYVGSSPPPAPAKAVRIDLAGHTITPGLVMMHEHINYFSGHYVWDSHPGSVPKLLLAAGVTTARTAGSEAPQVDLNLKARIDAGKTDRAAPVRHRALSERGRGRISGRQSGRHRRGRPIGHGLLGRPGRDVGEGL